MAARSKTVTTTLVEHDSKSGTGRSGKWVLNIFEDEGGDSYQTFDRKLASAVLDLLDEEVEIEYVVEENGDYDNNVIQAITGPDGETVKAEKKGGGGGSSRTSSRSAGRSTGRSGGSKNDDRGPIINRSAAVDRTASLYVAGSQDPFEDLPGFFAMCDVVVAYIEGGTDAAVKALGD